jgi:tetratricopeptide (TPR) repeat protein
VLAYEGYAMEVTVDQIFQEAIAAHNSGDLEEAKRLYSSILKIEPKHPRVIHNLGLIDLSKGKVASALQSFKVALEENSSIEQFWISYIDTLISEQQFENAKQAIINGERKGVAKKILNALEQKLISVKEGGISIKEPSETEIHKLINHYESAQYFEAETLALSITKQFPEHQFSWKVLGAVLKQTGKLSESLIANQKSIKLNSKDAEVHNNMGASLNELGRFEDAEESYRKAIALKPDYADAYNNLGITLKELGKLEEAEAILRQVITFKSDFAEAYNNLGITLEELDRFKDAEESYRKAIALKPDYADAYNNLGNTLKELGKLGEAEASYRQAINLKSDFAEAYSNLGATLKELGKLKEAEASFRQAINLKSNFAEAHNNLGKLLMIIGQHREGINEETIGAGSISFNLSKGFSIL